MNGYRLTQPRYGQEREGTAILIYVTEDFSERLRVKADASRHPKEGLFPVLKLNAVRDFSTGIYDYNVMTSTFLRVKKGWPVAKVSFSSQEWCGHVWHQILPRGDRLEGVSHSYFDGEADGRDELDLPDGGVFEDALPVVLRGWRGEFEVTVFTVTVEDARTLTYAIETASPYRLVRQTGPGSTSWTSAWSATEGAGGVSSRGWGRHGFDGNSDPERSKPSVPTDSLIRWEKLNCQRQFGIGRLTKP